MNRYQHLNAMVAQTPNGDPDGVNSQTIPRGVDSPYRAPLSERLSVWFRNLPSWPTALAVWYLSRQLQRDKAFRDSWHANIAMPIYDATRPQCLCHLTEENFHKWDCEQMRGRTASECRDMPATQANYIADKIMEHLFGA